MYQQKLNIEAIFEFEPRFRTNFINSLSGFKSATLIGSKSPAGISNLAIFSSIVHIGANPPLLGFISRPDTCERHTLNNILETGFYTINHVNQLIYKKAHQTAARYPKQISEFEACRLTEEYKDFYAPFVMESLVQIGMVFKERMHIAINNTDLIIGEINNVYYPENCLAADGFLDIEKAGTITISGLDSYHSTQPLSRLSYAKLDFEIQEIKSQFKE